MDQGNRPAHLRIAQCPEPTGLGGGILFDPGPDRLDDQNVGQAGDDGLAARAQRLGFGGHEADSALDPVRLEGVARLDGDQAGKHLDEVVGGRVVELDSAAQHRGGRAAAIDPQELVALAQLPAGQIPEIDGWQAWLADQAMPIAVGNQGQIARLEEARRGAIDFEPGPAPVMMWNMRELGNAGSPNPHGAVKAQLE